MFEGAVAGCLPTASDEQYNNFLSAAVASGANSTLFSLPQGLGTLVRPSSDLDIETTSDATTLTKGCICSQYNQLGNITFHVDVKVSGGA